MIFLAYIGACLAAYIIQTTLLSGWPLRPELVLLVSCLFLSGRSYASLILGCLTGLFLDVLNGYGLYNTALYALTGLLCGFMPVSIFRDLPSLAFVNMLISSLLLNVGYALLTWLLLGRAIFLTPLNYLAVVALNIIFFWLIALFFVRRCTYNPYD
ncbi:hypothetical protein NO2_0681 [Candidatus Termititenax persephonae]|uniref:Rod shape-determining protein MreD n=1 Tax=Candidatus Termititenax persephonae TaxID=2218525 RepID=A0A388THA6_9BACT|nr:hypothetical protein NO2_0681 [Candidatus Termititenax persephonae]